MAYSRWLTVQQHLLVAQNLTAKTHKLGIYNERDNRFKYYGMNSCLLCFYLNSGLNDTEE